MTRLAIVIGVDSIHGLPGLVRLNAAGDARKVSAWLTVEGYKTHEFVDEAKEGEPPAFSRKDVLAVIRDELATGAVTQIVVYFSGHGQHNGVDIWLLSGAAEDQTEAINLYSSLQSAQLTNLPHVVFIGDACRTLPADIQQNSITGGSIFPPPRTFAGKTARCDRFLAVNPGFEAIETRTLPPEAEYRGLFTQALVDCFENPPPDKTITLPDIGVVLPNRRLEDILPDKVVDVYLSRQLARERLPFLDVPSSDTAYIARVKSTGAAPSGLHPIQEIGRELVTRHLDRDRLPPTIDPGRLESLWTGAGGRRPTGVGTRRRTSASASRRSLSPDSPAGATVLGLEATRRSGRAADLYFETAGLARNYREGGLVSLGPAIRSLRVFPEGAASPVEIELTGGDRWHAIGPFAPGHALIEFSDGAGALIANYVGYTAILMVDERDGKHTVGSLAYRNRRTMDIPEETARSRAYHEEAQRLLRSGRFGVDRADSARLAERVRQSKGTDPTLGAMAGYAYLEAALPKSVRAVSSSLKNDLDGYLPADLLLAEGASFGKRSSAAPLPALPMLSRGWHLMEISAWSLPAFRNLPAERLMKHLRPALWTTFTPEGMALLRGAD